MHGTVQVRADGSSDRRVRPLLAAGSVVLLTLAVLIAVSPRILLYDERYYMESSYFLAEYFDFGRLMRTPLDLAAGPLYPYLHVALSPLTDLRPPAIRYVNFGCLAVAIGACAGIIRRLGWDSPLARATMLLAVPMILPTSGLALTELPPLALVTLATLAVAEAVVAPAPARRWLLWTLAGLAAGLAVVGRQTYLPGLAGFLLVGLARRRHLVPALVATAVAAAVVAPMVAAWGGLTPPWQVLIATRIAPEHGILAFIYLATAGVLIAPGFFLDAVNSPGRRIAAGLAVLACVAAALLAGLRFSVAGRVLALVPPVVQEPVSLAVNAAMIGAASALLVAALIHLWARRGDVRFVLFAFLTFVLTGTAAGISHQFSSRYVLVAFPFALLMLQPWVRPGPWAAVRLVLGASLGFASLAAYYWNAPPTDPDFTLSAPREIVAKMPLGDVEKGLR